MGVWLRRLRAALGNAVMWAVGWAGVGAGISLVYGLLGWEVLPFRGLTHSRTSGGTAGARGWRSGRIGGRLIR